MSLPSHYPALKLLDLASRALQAGRTDEAEDHLRQVLRYQPDNAIALQQLALLLYGQGDRVAARSLLERAVAAEPEDFQLLLALGQILHECSEPRLALALYLRALAVRSAEAEVWNAAGICLQEISEPVRAIEFYLRAIALQPGFAEAYNNLGVVLTREGDLQGAIENFQASLAINPEGADCLSNLGVALRHSFRYAESRAAFQHSLELRPDHADTVGALGELLSLIYAPEAERILRHGIALRPDDPDKHWNLAIDLLKHGDFAAAWPEFEWRRRQPNEIAQARRHTEPDWPGPASELVFRNTDAAGTTVLLHAEQGFGDTIQFLRYLPQVIALGSDVVVEVHPELLRLTTSYARQWYPQVRVYARGQSLPPCRWQLPLMSLPRVFLTARETVPSPARLTPGVHPVGRAPLDTGRSAGPMRVGLAWAGNAKHGRDRERSVPTGSLLPLFSVPGVEWVSLQVGANAPMLQGIGLELQTPTLPDFEDTAAWIDTLDLVITADTAVAHLAASQGAPTWILLPFVGDWRWLTPPAGMDAVETNPWYRDARIFRQTRMPAGEPQAELWKPVIAVVRAELAKLVASREGA